jgi:hypothetical protein
MSTPAAPTLDPSEVQVGTPNGPGIYIAEAGTEPPDSTDEEWGSEWSILGYLSDDGPTVGSSTDSESLQPWQSAVPLREVITGRSITMQFVIWSLNEQTLALYFDADVPTAGSDGSIDMELRTDTPAHLYAIGIDSADAERVFRISFRRASLSAAGDMAISRGAAVPLDCTLSALDDGGVLGRVQLGARASGGGGNGGSGNGNGRRRHAERAEAAA